jgi:type IV pilus assembly protein PilB
MPTLKDTIIEVLLKSKYITKEQLDKALQLQKSKSVPLKKALLGQGVISEEALLSLISEQLYIPTLHLTKYKFDPAVLNIIPEQMARLYGLIPLSRMGNTLTVAMSDPLNVLALDDLKAYTGCDIDIVLSPEDEINDTINTQYNTGTPSEGLQDLLDKAALQQLGLEGKNIELFRQDELVLTAGAEKATEAPIVKLVNFMLIQALKKRASDIHIEPEMDFLRVRYRIDGALHDIFKIPKITQNAVLARLKIISNLDITESRLPQDGRFKVKLNEREVDFRVSALPTTFGQKFVLRLLDKGNLRIGLDKLGFAQQPLEVFKQAVAKPFGMILVTGPTGSGKSTTLYSVLNQLNTPQRNIVTIEDPVEYQVEGVTQVQVKPEIKLDFARGLRAVLRQSPDVIMVGEIRDGETADIAVKAALTGQLVLSTLHTNDAISSITRLIDMGVEPFLVASSLVMLCAQRLARRICPRCRKLIEVPKDFLEKIGFTQFLRAEGNLKEDAVFYTASGCDYCNHTGFYGRIAILEALLIDDKIREMIIKKESIETIRNYAVGQCRMKTLRDDSFLKVREQLTTLEEALRITTEE